MRLTYIVSLLRRSSPVLGPKGIEPTGADVTSETELEAGCWTDGEPPVPLNSVPETADVVPEPGLGAGMPAGDDPVGKEAAPGGGDAVGGPSDTLDTVGLDSSVKLDTALFPVPLLDSPPVFALSGSGTAPLVLVLSKLLSAPWEQLEQLVRCLEMG